MIGKLAKNEIGNRYGSLKVIERADSDNGYARFVCKCDCGKTIIARGSDLRSGNTKSCGCSKGESHKMSKSRLYDIWQHMRRRTNNELDHAYKDYGGRGISVCSEWNDSFLRFKEWADSSGYDDSLTIERINVNDGYNPQNCKWIPNNNQAKNRRNCVWLTFNGETKCATEWAKEFGIKPSIALDRIRNGWDPYDAMTAPICPRRKHKCTTKNALN